MIKMEHKTEENEKHEDSKEEEKNGGIMTGIISDLVNGRKIENLEDEIESDEKVMTSEVGNSGGIINNIISKIVHHNDEVVENEMSGIQSDEKEENGAKNEEHKSSIGGNIIDKIVSHLPSSLTEDVDPPTDEASILIHSIIHD